MSAAAFDSIASRYDDLWTRSPVGRLQRGAVWRRIDALFSPGDSVLDLGCGTGEDALHLMERGIRVCAIDTSPQMAHLAGERGVDARVLAIEHINQLEGRFDGALSDFGALNCVEGLDSVALALARLIRPGGYFVACTIGRFCLREVFHYTARLDFRSAVRRFLGPKVWSRTGLHVVYPSVRQTVAAFRPHFALVDWTGVGLLIPPSYITGIADSTLSRLDSLDRRLAHRPVLRGWCDHRLLTFRRT
ncbi:MAG TPA: methyltransferase domain-containing protein [Bryobacteraceae bacterium]|jgi:ubiquinone/menaquinone biosynthesis C-methylase UbiE